MCGAPLKENVAESSRKKLFSCKANIHCNEKERNTN